MSRFTFREVEEIAISGAGVYYFHQLNPAAQEKIGIQYQIESPSSIVGSVGIDIKAHENAAWMPFTVSGTAYSSTIVTATGFIQGSAGKLTWLSKSTTTPGNEIRVVLVGGGTAGAETVAVATNSVTSVTTITVTIQSGVSTATQIKTAIDNSAAAFALVSTTVTTSGAMEAASVQLVGGGAFIDLETAAPYIRVRVNVTSGTCTMRCFMGAKS
jgi:hypothetical protein